MNHSEQPAFARPHSVDANSIPRGSQVGMSKREVFIAHAMHAHIIAAAMAGKDPQQEVDAIAQAAESAADAQLARLK